MTKLLEKGWGDGHKYYILRLTLTATARVRYSVPEIQFGDSRVLTWMREHLAQSRNMRVTFKTKNNTSLGRMK